MKKVNHPYPPFDFNFYLDTDVSSENSSKNLDELSNPVVLENKKFFQVTPYARGFCNICGKETVFFCKNLVHPRDYLVCMHCGSTSRYRSIARGLISALQDLTGKEIGSLFDLRELRLGRKVVVYDTQLPFSLGVVTYSIPYFLSLSKDIELHLSDLHCKKDEVGLNGELISNQNLQGLTFESGKFDIVITSDVMEHVRLPSKAHAEISRVTKKNGFYVFTVPHFRHSYETYFLIKVHDEEDSSKDENLVEPVYHGDPNSGDAAVVYQVFGLEIDDELKALSFVVEYTAEKFLHQGILGTELFLCRKIEGGVADEVTAIPAINPRKSSLLKRIFGL
jgi:SAM-dependent methyltransferase